MVDIELNDKPSFEEDKMISREDNFALLIMLGTFVFFALLLKNGALAVDGFIGLHLKKTGFFSLAIFILPGIVSSTMFLIFFRRIRIAIVLFIGTTLLWVIWFFVQGMAYIPA